VLNEVLGVAGGDGQVEPVDRRRPDPHPDLTLGGLGYLQVGQGGALSNPVMAMVRIAFSLHWAGVGGWLRTRYSE
jgi:hypothetical protein